jgi:hypothetical protein
MHYSLRYDKLTGSISEIDYPDDNILVFDVETLVELDSYPMMAVAASSDAW